MCSLNQIANLKYFVEIIEPASNYSRSIEVAWGPWHLLVEETDQATS